MRIFILLIIFSLIIVSTSFTQEVSTEVSPMPKTIVVYDAKSKKDVTLDIVSKTEEQWKLVLDEKAFDVARRQGTERAFTGKYWNNHKKGMYQCIGCGLDLFSSETKFESGTGWPSFYEPIDPRNIAMEEDDSLFMKRIEVHCPRCGAHLGHVFDDGPQPTGKRFCINSVSLNFVEDK